MIGAGVYLWGTRIGTVAQEDSAHAAVFTYERDFLRSGIEVSPLWMPLSAQNYSFPGLMTDAFRGLPGMLADSLPDRYGSKLLGASLLDTVYLQLYPLIIGLRYADAERAQGVGRARG